MEGQRVFLGFGLGSVTEGRVNRFALEPIMKLVGVVLAAGLAGLSRGDEEDGTIPIREIGYKAFGRAMVAAGGAGAEGGTGLRLVGKAKEFLQKALAAEGMQHIQIVEALPLPVFGVGLVGAFFQTLDGAIGGGAQ